MILAVTQCPPVCTLSMHACPAAEGKKRGLGERPEETLEKILVGGLADMKEHIVVLQGLPYF